MDFRPENPSVSSIQGQLLRLSERRQVAIYRREDRLWVADFIDGHGELIDATTWFRFNCGTLATTHARRRMVRESAIPISSQLVAKIERLHCPVNVNKGGAMVALAGAIATHRSRSRLARILCKLFGRRPTLQADLLEGGMPREDRQMHRSGAT